MEASFVPVAHVRRVDSAIGRQRMGSVAAGGGCGSRPGAGAPCTCCVATLGADQSHRVSHDRPVLVGSSRCILATQQEGAVSIGGFQAGEGMEFVGNVMLWRCYWDCGCNI